jgi:hypothetical protein
MSISALTALPADQAGTRRALQRVAVHVVARARHAAVGRFGLRPTAGGFGTPTFGSDHEVVRVSGGLLVVESAGAGGSSHRSRRLSGSTLAELASFAGVTFDPSFSVGEDTPDLGDPDAALAVDDMVATVIAGWFAFGQHVLDEVLAGVQPLDATATPSALQLWPEHFDLGTDALVGSGRVNLGASPGDAAHATPYLYLGPWDGRRPGPAEHWNAPFGAVLSQEALAAVPDPVEAAVRWFGRGLDALRAA